MPDRPDMITVMFDTTNVQAVNACRGTYTVMFERGGIMWRNRCPVWRHADGEHYIFGDSDGSYAISNAESMLMDFGPTTHCLMQREGNHFGKAPHVDAGAWLRWTGHLDVQDPWVVEPTFIIQAGSHGR